MKITKASENEYKFIVGDVVNITCENSNINTYIVAEIYTGKATFYSLISLHSGENLGFEKKLSDLEKGFVKPNSYVVDVIKNHEVEITY